MHLEYLRRPIVLGQFRAFRFRCRPSEADAQPAADSMGVRVALECAVIAGKAREAPAIASDVGMSTDTQDVASDSSSAGANRAPQQLDIRQMSVVAA